jgi:hypothetical protein
MVLRRAKPTSASSSAEAQATAKEATRLRIGTGRWTSDANVRRMMDPAAVSAAQPTSRTSMRSRLLLLALSSIGGDAFVETTPLALT